MWRDIGGAFYQTVWNRAVARAEEFNDPGRSLPLPGTNGRPSAEAACLACLPATCLPAAGSPAAAGAHRKSPPRGGLQGRS